MKDRLSILLSVKSLTALRFAEIMDVQPSSISHILSGRNNPNYGFILKLIERFPDISPDWLLLGQGDMFRNIDPTPDELEGNQVVELPEITEFEMSTVQIKEKNEEIHKETTTQAPLPAQELASILPKKEGAQVSKVIIFYTDGTFESFSER